MFRNHHFIVTGAELNPFHNYNSLKTHFRITRLHLGLPTWSFFQVFPLISCMKFSFPQ